MGTSLKKTVVLLGIAGVVGSGFVWGRSLSAGNPAKPQSALDRLAKALTHKEGMFSLAGMELGQDPSIPPAEVFENVLEKIQRDYVASNHNPGSLSRGAISQMLASLEDPKTAFLEPEQRKTRQEALLGKFRGVGAALAQVRTKVGEVPYVYVTVIAVMPGSPAQKAGLKTGDRIVEIDGRWVRSYSIAVDVDRIRKSEKSDKERQEEFEKLLDRFQKGFTPTKAVDALTTGEGKALKLAVQRSGQPTPIKLDLTTAVTEVNPVEFSMANQSVGVLRIRQFNPRATQEFQQIFANLNPNLKGIVIDLRQNPGGVQADAKAGTDGYDSALKLLGYLAGNASVKIARRPKEVQTVKTPAAAKPIKLPLAVLVDQGTSNLSELVASTLRTARNAKIYGSRTFGDPALQLFTVLKDGSGIEMTTAHLFNAAGEELSKGVMPDVAAGDDALQRALATLGA